MKQETLAEASENYLNSGKIPNDYRSFIAGAKWQQEHYGLMEIELKHTKTLLASCEKALEERDKQQKISYNEEDMKSAWDACKIFQKPISEGNALNFNEFIEQFKKK